MREFSEGAPSRLPSTQETQPAITSADLSKHVTALTDPEMQGRMAGSPGEKVAADYLEREMARLGLAPSGDEGAFLHAFEFTSGVALGPNNTLNIAQSASSSAPSTNFRALKVQEDWRPLAFSRSARLAESEIVFAGYGIVAPASAGTQSLNEYARVDAQDRWVIVFRGMPREIEGDRRQHLQRHVSLRHKAMVARDHGARGILFMSGPRGQFREELAPLRFDASLAGTRIGALTLTNNAANAIFEAASSGLGEPSEGSRLAAIQARVDEHLVATLKGKPTAANRSIGQTNLGLRLEGRIDLDTIRSIGHNVLGRLQVGTAPSAQTVVIGAHFDHLGFGEATGSLAKADEKGRLHPGADDNASGVAALLEVAEALIASRDAGEFIGRRDFIFAAWSGEELGLLGSDAWARDQVNPHSNESGPVAYLNFDMVGRLRDKLIVQGLGSSPAWDGFLDSAAAKGTLRISRQEDAYLPTDVSSFYIQGVPVLAAFTGVHNEYHTPRDVTELLNLEGTVEIAGLFKEVAAEVSRSESAPTYEAQKQTVQKQTGSGFRVFLGTIPDYAQTEVVGVLLSGVAPGGPADQVGIRAGDLIVEVDGRTIENLYDYTYALQALRVGKTTRIVIKRAEKRLLFDVVPLSRD